MITAYLALYGPKGSVISDHPYNADSGWSAIASIGERRAQSSRLWGALAAVAVCGKNVPDGASGASPGIAWPLWR
jgi:hypothetical protein